MLERRTVDPKTLELLKQLMLLPELREFCLAGGAVEWEIVKGTITEKLEKYIHSSGE